ncbi:uncharacterized protein LOC110684290 [Chenopodium quinoa]|uniref:XS domain-containing protein n=1 Tax=Chenopodium quinoa TaxID=63459 RepID=A0A803LD64_CHEQI|nr:uncharacterized protein LOC110684290 [Chenopodium quinoa]
MTREGRRIVDRQDDDGRREMDYHGERIGERERGSSRHLSAEDRGVGLVRMNRNGDEQLRTFSRFNDQDIPIRDGAAEERRVGLVMMSRYDDGQLGTFSRFYDQDIAIRDGAAEERGVGLVRMSRNGDEQLQTFSRFNDHDISIRDVVAEERGVGLVRMSRNGDRQLQTFSRFNDQDIPIRDGDTASKFQWKNLMREPGNSMVVDERISGNENNGRETILVEGEVFRNLPTNEYNARNAEYRGRTRNVTCVLVDDPDYHGRIRNVMTELPNEGAEYHTQNRNVTGFRVEDADYNGHTRNLTGLRIEKADYNGNTTNMIGHPVEDVEYSRSSRKQTGLSVEDAEYHRRTRSVMTCRPAEDGGRYLARNYSQHMDREFSSANPYEDGNYHRFQGEDSSRSLTPRSQSSGQHTPSQGITFPNLDVPRQVVFHHPADGIGTSGNNPSSSCYDSHGILYSKAGTNALSISNNDGVYLRAGPNSNTGRHAECMHSESQRSGKNYGRALSEDAYDKYENVQGYNNYGETFENDTLNPALPRHKDDRRHSSDHTLREAPITDGNGFRTTPHEIQYGGVELKPTSCYREHQTQTNYETTPHEEEYPYEIDAYGASYEDQTGNYSTLEEGTLTVDEDPEQVLRSREIDLHDHPKKISKRKRGLVGKMSGSKHRTSTLGGRGALSYDNRLLSADLDNELGHSNRSLSQYFHSNETARKPKTESKQLFGGLSKRLQSRLSKPGETDSNDIKNRLKYPHFIPRCYGPKALKFLKGNDRSTVKPSLNVNHIDSQPHGKEKCNSTRKRLKRPSFMDVSSSDTPVSHSGLDIESQQKLAAKNSGSTKEAGPPQEADPDHSILKVKPMEKDPPENTEELKRQVDHWCLKCMLYLNTNLGRQKKFKEQGKAGTLKCVICSSSKEFIQTKDVASHAFTSVKIGFRAAHLGFHRALCILMGWDPTVASNGRWVCQSLPDAEAWALKEDIIMWPPVVIIHNGSARDFYNNEQVKISIEQVENILRDMGLSEEKTTVCHGKPGNPNIILAKFNGTLSGLQEAERLHNVFSRKKHGRAELQEIDAGIGSNEGDSQKPEDKAEDSLYGYLGIVEDFDKLNYDMRRHCVAESKKDILACMDTAS